MQFGTNIAPGIKRLAIAVAVIATVVVLYKLKYPTYSYRYRLTVNLDVDGQLRAGSSVIEAYVRKNPPLLLGNRLAFSIHANAVLVQIPDNKLVVALLASGPLGQDVDFLTRLVPSHFKLELFKDQQLAQLPMVRGNWDLSPAEFPTMILFEQPRDPRSARHLKAGETIQMSGRLVRIRGVTVEITNDPVTVGIESKLGWWKDPGRPTVVAVQAAGLWTASSTDAESAFSRNGY
ncbi:hypothetical protein [Bradyrhizobium sp. JYMT SZCCT0180]|uniref:hypothetical protein n=1 Tax=Bradyrhizobium sp. JYMT SZCCT0180 TaxID=2807666 RepID=UPI001BA6C6AD|nr:hypothetical protein [Bradyrhizobium sp. JYMT SZCCT0180]MBR1211439.1 hypothetical protein [Bradyrhizobium sp. JYMT SZCCT0180]